MEMHETKYVWSKHLQLLRLDDLHVIASNGMTLRRSVLRNEVAELLSLLHYEGESRSEFVEKAADVPKIVADRIFMLFVESGYVVPISGSEDDEIRLRLQRNLVDPSIQLNQHETTGNWFDWPVPLSLESFNVTEESAELEKINVLMLGGCFTQSAAHIIEEIGLSYGLHVHVTTGWPESLHLIEENDARIVVFQPATMWLLGPLWDGFAFIGDDARLTRLQTVKDYLAVVVQQLLARSVGRLVLVQGVCPPQMPPSGRLDFRLDVTFSRIIFEINSHLQELISKNLNAIFVDEARIFANTGVHHLLDDMINVYSHHAPLDFSTAPGPESQSRMNSFNLKTQLMAVRLLAKEYFECYRLWTDKRKIKCIVVDLDNTLWPGEVGDPAFALDDYRSFEFLRYGRFGGLHQALKIMKERGVMLATCSNNDFNEVMRHWRALGPGVATTCPTLRSGPPEGGESLSNVDYILRPDDFVIHRIDWNSKTQKISEIAHALGISPESILFIDDNRIHLDEVKAAFPKIRTAGLDMNKIRYELLSDPCLEFNNQSEEATNRTETVRAQLRRRQAAQAGIDKANFLRGLNIRIRVFLLREEKIGRVIELIHRTTQFNTTGKTWDAESLRILISDSSTSIYLAEVSDCFAAYGIVGVCVIRNSNIESFVLSCRVIELEIALPFVISVLQVADIRWPVTGELIATDRNQPCHNLFLQAGFSLAGDSKYMLQTKAHLRSWDSSVYQVNLDELTTRNDDKTAGLIPSDFHELNAN